MDEFSWQSFADGMSRLWERFRAQLPDDLLSREAATELVRLTRPVEPFNYFDLAAPIIGLAGLVTGLLLVGVALASLGTLLASMLALGFLLTEVYGVSVEVDDFPAP